MWRDKKGLSGLHGVGDPADGIGSLTGGHIMNQIEGAHRGAVAVAGGTSIVAGMAKIEI